MNWNRETLKGDFLLANSWFRQQRKSFCIGLWLEMRSRYSTTIPRRKNTTLSPVNHCIDLNINTTAEHSSFEDHILYLVGPKGSCLLWAAEIWWFHYGRSVSVIQSFEPCIARKTEYEQRHDKVILLHDNAQPHVIKIIKKYLDAQMGCFTAPAVFSGYCSFWLLVVPKNATNHRFTSFTEIENWLQNWIASKDESFFRDGIRKLPERGQKVVSSDGQCFNWSVHSFCFEINAFLNGPN